MKQEEFAGLCRQRPLLLDGATGSELMKGGMPRGVCTEAWILEHPEVLQSLQRAYAQAGSDIIYAPTFAANAYGLARHGLEKEVASINARLVALTREAVGGAALVAGDLTTTGVPLEPVGDMSYERLFEIYQEQIRALAESGVDLLVVETMLAVDETVVALEAAQSVCDLPVMCSLTVQADGSAYFGGDCMEAVLTLQELGAAAVGINCSCGPEQLLSLVRNMKQEATVPLLVKPNAGMPIILDNGETRYPMGPEDFARHMKTLVEAGANVIGGCCGTGPAYIAALKGMLI